MAHAPAGNLATVPQVRKADRMIAHAILCGTVGGHYVRISSRRNEMIAGPTQCQDLHIQQSGKGGHLCLFFGGHLGSLVSFLLSGSNSLEREASW